MPVMMGARGVWGPEQDTFGKAVLTT
jgi:hypothetical protein